MTKIPAIIGPTASGKSKLAMALAKYLQAEIISLDSMQIYQQLDIGTAKVTLQERREVKHHFIDILAPTSNYSIANFLDDYHHITKELAAKAQAYILAGGSLQYFLALFREDNYATSHTGDETYRLNLQNNYEAYAKTHLDNKFNPVYLKLCELDAKRAAALHPNDMKRIIRALEICQSGCKASEQDPRNLNVKNNANYAIFAFDWEREHLYQRINERVDKMLQDGLLKEAEWVYTHRDKLSTSCLQAIGYKELFPYFSKESSLNDAVQQLKLNSRHYAKRQLSIMRKLPVTYIDPSLELNEQLALIVAKIKQ